MMNLEKAKALLVKEELTLVMYNGNDLITSKKRGVKPLIDLIKSGKDYRMYSAVDKVVGKGAAFLYVLLGVKSVYAYTISESAIKLLAGRGIDVEYAVLTDRIKNRTNTDFCPVETAVLDIDDENVAYDIIKNTLDIIGA